MSVESKEHFFKLFINTVLIKVCDFVSVFVEFPFKFGNCRRTGTFFVQKCCWLGCVNWVPKAKSLIVKSFPIKIYSWVSLSIRSNVFMSNDISLRNVRISSHNVRDDFVKRFHLSFFKLFISKIDNLNSYRSTVQSCVSSPVADSSVPSPCIFWHKTVDSPIFVDQIMSTRLFVLHISENLVRSKKVFFRRMNDQMINNLKRQGTVVQLHFRSSVQSYFIIWNLLISIWYENNKQYNKYFLKWIHFHLNISIFRGFGVLGFWGFGVLGFGGMGNGYG